MYGYQPIIPQDSRDLLLSYSQEAIFGLVFGYLPVAGIFVVSPFREDNNPGCWFEWNNDQLIFKDFGEVKGRKQRDCFQAVKDYYNLPDFYSISEFIVSKLDGQEVLINSEMVEYSLQNKKSKKSGKSISFKERKFFEERDKLTWSPFEITLENLKEDVVLPVVSYRILSEAKSTLITPYFPAYVIYQKDERLKIYIPKSKSKKSKWISTCNQNDIGNYDNLELAGDLLFITKSYKDFRVIKNQGFYNVVWFQNEGAFPDESILYDLAIRFKKIIIFFDNDRQGITASKDLVAIFEKMGKKTEAIHSPYLYLKDPAEMIFAKGKQEFNQFLWQKSQQ